MAVARFGALNPSLENLRDSIEPKINVDIEARELIQLLSKYHAGFLFEDVGEEVLRILCSWLGAAAVGKPYSDWTEFASLLDLERVHIRNIQNWFQKPHGPVWWVLLTYAQWDNATIGKIIHALLRMEDSREDIIYKLNNDLRELARRVSSHHSLEDEELEILRPAEVPWVPLVLRPPSSEIKKVYKIVNITSIISPITEQGGNEITNKTVIRVPLALRVMLTFASDGIEAADRITRMLRSHQPRIGVLILNEQMSHVFEKGLEFVDDCMEQVDAVMPILTKGYFDKINRRTVAKKSESSYGRDEEYVKYIYENLRQEFQYNGCTNKRVACILPGGENYEVPRMNSVLRAYYSEDRVEEFINFKLREKSGKR